MKSKTIRCSLLGASLLIGGAHISYAQPAWLNSSPEQMPDVFMASEDLNKDGNVTSEEFQGPARDFTFFDKNKDGVIELSEAPTPNNLPPNLKIQSPSGKTGGTAQPGMATNGSSQMPVAEVILNGVPFKLYKKYDFFTWQELPSDVEYERMGIKEFTDPDGVTHYYEAVYLPSGNLNWFQAAYLAEDAGGYLATLTSKEENDFVFSLVDEEKYFWKFPKYDGNPQRMNHYEIKIGPFLGGYQPEGSPEPAGGWQWLSGESWQYTNWAVNLDDGVIDKDPRKNTQPNDSGYSAQGQRVMGFGEMNLPVSTWGDYMDDVGTYGVKRSPGKSYGFVIEYERHPNQ